VRTRQHWAPLKKLVKPGASCVITTHYSPDGDAVGSELALAEFLGRLGARAHIINQDPIPRIYRFLEGTDAARTYSPADNEVIRTADVIFLLDVSAWNRIGSPAEALRVSAATRVCIDHHTTNDGIADFDVVDPAASATGELIYDMLAAFDASISGAMARALFVAVATDTGWFRFANTSARVFEIAADLTRRGALPAELYACVHERLRWERLALLGRGLAEMHSAADGRIIWTAFTREMFQQTGADSEDVEGIIDLLRTTGGIDIAILFREDADGSIRVSLRSKNEADVSELAEKFGGGGHARAAGIRMTGTTLDEATRTVVAAAEELIRCQEST